ncbi:N-acetyltransferase [Desulfobacterales bacterium HSG16]|nr:N-acetyltransferase [Desulfobacterales bacterium HSG16]
MIRKARLCDVNTIHRILNEYGNKGELLPRPLSKIYDHLRDFTVYTDEKTGDILGCCSLQFCWDDLAEIRSLAVHPEHIRNKIGTQLVSDALQDACRYKVKNVFTLTYRPGFFEKFGFNVIDRAKLPLKIWSDCILCVKFPDCDETAMLKKI